MYEPFSGGSKGWRGVCSADGRTIGFVQKYQTVTGKVTNDKDVAPIKQGKINHDKIEFQTGDGATYSAKISGDVMEGGRIGTKRDLVVEVVLLLPPLWLE